MRHIALMVMARMTVLRRAFWLDLRHHGNVAGIKNDVDLKVVALMQVCCDIRHPKGNGVRGQEQFRTSMDSPARTATATRTCVATARTDMTFLISPISA